jgi:DNA-binding HxlR family transcriptional regulator
LNDDLIGPVAAGLAGRLRVLVVALDRLDRLESGSGTWRNSFNDEELPEAATEISLRALRTVADPATFVVLKTLASGDSFALKHLIETTGVGRLTLSERLNDLVQVGLASRLIDTDHAQVTAAGAGLARLVAALISGVTKQYSSDVKR